MSNTRKYSLFPKTLSSCIEPLTRPLFRSKSSALTRLLTQWESIAGPKLARHTRVEKLSFPQGQKTGGTLTIAVENGFNTELQHQQVQILQRLAEYFGYRAIDRVVISHSFWPETKPKSVTSPAPLPSECKRLADNVEDGELKAALQSLAKTLTEQI